MNNFLLEQLISRLKSIDENREALEYFDKFYETVCEIAHLHNPTSILALVQFFDDDSPEIDLMTNIVHTIESFERDIYIKEILEASPFMYKKSSYWSSFVFVRIINSDEYIIF